MIGRDLDRRPVEQQPLGHRALVRRDRREALELLGVHDREVEPGPGGVVEEDRVHHLAGRGRQPEGHVRDPEHGPAAGQLGLHGTQPLEGLDRAPEIGLVAARHREDQRIDHQVLVGEAEACDQQVAGAARDLQLVLAGESLAALVDAARHHRGPEAREQGGDRGDPLLAVLEVDRVDDRAALAEGEGELDRVGVGRVDHDRRLGRANQALVEDRHVGDLVALGRLQADVDDLRPAADLAAGDLGRLVPALFRHQATELRRADHVGALADQQRAGLVGRLDQIDTGVEDPPRPVAGNAPGRAPLDHRSERGDVAVGGAAAAADQIQPAVVGEALERRRQALGGLRVAAVRVRETRVGVAGDRGPGHLVHGAEVVGHQVGTGRAVEPDREQRRVLEGGHERIRGLAGEHRAHRLDRAGDHHRPSRAELGEHPLDGDQRRLGVAGVLAGLDQQQVGAALDQAPDLLREGLDELGEGDAAGDRDRLRGRSDRARHEARTAAVRRRVRGLAGKPRGHPVDLAGAVLEPVLGEHDRGATEGVGLDDVGAGGEVGVVDLAHHVRAVQHQRLVAAVVALAAVVDRRQLLRLQHRPGRAVEDQDPLLEEVVELRAAIAVSHGRLRRARPASGRAPRRAAAPRPPGA